MHFANAFFTKSRSTKIAKNQTYKRSIALSVLVVSS